MDNEIFDLLLNEEEISWRNVLYDLVRMEKMDPWDINITALTQKYIQIVKEMQEHDLRISGKMVLAAAILLKIKSTYLVENDIGRLDEMINDAKSIEEDPFEQVEEDGVRVTKVKDKFQLIPRNPQPRNRKVSIHDLVEALQHAMQTKKRVLERIRPVPFKMPERKIDIMEAIRDVYHKIIYYDKKDAKVTFARLLPANAGRQEKAFTFIPLLHLEHQQKVNLEQEKAFAEITIRLMEKTTKSS